MRHVGPRYEPVPLRRHLHDYWNEVREVAATISLDHLEAASLMLLDCQARAGIVFIAGNGGSAATASHMACDLVKGTRRNGPPTFRAMALTDNASLITAWANDVGYDHVFAEQFASLAGASDLLVAISASGNSANILAVIETARSIGIPSLGLTGRQGGQLARAVDLVIRVPSDRIEIVEDAHLIVAHSLCVAVRERFIEQDGWVAAAPGHDGPRTYLPFPKSSLDFDLEVSSRHGD